MTRQPETASIITVSQDGKRHTFRNQPKNVADDFIVAAINGLGYVLKDGDVSAIFGPGDITRACVVPDLAPETS